MSEKIDLKYICRTLDITEEEGLKLKKVLVKIKGSYEIGQCIKNYIQHLRAQIPERHFVDTMQEVADAIGVDVRTIRRYKADNGYKKHKGGYDVDEAKRVKGIRAENQLAKTKSGDEAAEEGGDTLREHEKRLKKAKADIEEFKRDQQRGQLVDINAVRREQYSRELSFKRTFTGLPAAMAVRLVGLGVNEINAKLTDYIMEGFRKLVKEG